MPKSHYQPSTAATVEAESPGDERKAFFHYDTSPILPEKFYIAPSQDATHTINLKL